MKKREPKSRARAVADLPPATGPIREIVFKQIVEEECRALGLQYVIVAQDLIGHSARLQFRPSDDKNAGLLRARAFAAAEEMKPDGIMQTMLAVQMVGVHSAIVDFLSRATAMEQTGEVIDRNVARATKLMRLFNEQCELMQKLKGQHGQQKIVVERVEVHQGGKAMVGAITAGNQLQGGGTGHEEKK